MKKYTLYFSLFGKKMKTEIQADNQLHAMQILRNKIEIIKVEEKEISNPIEDFFKGFRK